MDANARRHLTVLMIRLADGDRSVFDEVYLSLQPAILSFCGKVLPNADAEDATQQVLLKVFRQASAFRRSGDALTWAIAIAAWEVRTFRKRMSRSRTTSMENREPIDPAENAETVLSRAQLLALAAQVLGALSETDRETLRETFEDRPPTQVQGATFRKRRERALHRLREAWRRVYGS